LRKQISDCAECGDQLGVANNPKKGQIPRGLYIDDPRQEVDVVVIGFNPGPVGYKKGGPYPIEKKNIVEKALVSLGYHTSKKIWEWQRLLTEVEQEIKLGFDEVDFYKKCYENNFEEKHLASQIVFDLTKNVKGSYYEKLLSFVKWFLQKENPNIFWTNVVKCESKCKKIGCVHEEAVNRCYEKFLKKEMQIQNLTQKWIIVVSKRACTVLFSRLNDRKIVGVPHPTGGGGVNFRRMMNFLRPEDRESIENIKRCWLKTSKDKVIVSPLC
jgi:hypothetical protein